MGNLRIHNTIKTDCQKVTCSEDSVTKLNIWRSKNWEQGWRWAVGGLINRKAVQTCLIPLLCSLIQLKMKEQLSEVDNLPPEIHSVGDRMKAKNGIMV